MNAIEAEILAALAKAEKPLTSTDLADLCPSAIDRQAISRRLYFLAQNSQIEHVGEKRIGHARESKIYKISDAGRVALAGHALGNLGPAPAADEIAPPVIDREPVAEALAALLDEPVAEDAQEPDDGAWYPPIDDYCVAIPDDRTDEALAAMLDEIDEAVLAYADLKLAGDAFWRRLRRMQEGAFDALTTYRGGKHDH